MTSERTSNYCGQIQTCLRPFWKYKNAIFLVIQTFCFWIYIFPLIRVISSWSGTCKIICNRGANVKSWISFTEVLRVFKEYIGRCFLAYINSFAFKCHIWTFCQSETEKLKFLLLLEIFLFSEGLYHCL